MQPEARRGPSALVASAVFHSAAIAFILSTFLYAPHFRLPTPDVYMMQHVSLNMPYPPIPKSGGSGSSAYSKAATGEESSAVEKIAAPASSRIHFMHRKLAPQTLIQPDVDPDKMLPKETPLPSMLLWSGHRPKVQMLTPPKPQPPSITLDKPKLNFPNKETHIAALDISPTPFTSKMPMPVTSKSSPVILNRQLEVERIPETGSISSIEATPAAVLSASDLHMTREWLVCRQQTSLLRAPKRVVSEPEKLPTRFRMEQATVVRDLTRRLARDRTGTAAKRPDKVQAGSQPVQALATGMAAMGRRQARETDKEQAIIPELDPTLGLRTATVLVTETTAP